MIDYVEKTWNQWQDTLLNELFDIDRAIAKFIFRNNLVLMGVCRHAQ